MAEETYTGFIVEEHNGFLKMYTILVVDDDVQMLELISQLLEREGYHVQTAESADTALMMVERQLPDLFIIDAVLPEIDGLSLTSRRADMTYPF